MTEEIVVIVPVIIGIISVAKKSGLNTKYAPLLALILGVIGGYIFVGATPQGLLQGMMAGLAASGLFAGYKTVTK